MPQRDVGAPPVALGAVSRHHARGFEDAQVVREVVRRETHGGTQLAGREIAIGERVDHGESMGIRERGEHLEPIPHDPEIT